MPTYELTIRKTIQERWLVSALSAGEAEVLVEADFGTNKSYAQKVDTCILSFGVVPDSTRISSRAKDEELAKEMAK